jgi:CelD/BcsL family acetyltransferase involved in cellulose biosynthesis
VTWLGSYLCNYNGPLLAGDFASRVSKDRFVALWQEITTLLRGRSNHDLVDLEKMPGMIGGQANPFIHIGMTPHVNDAYLTHLTGDWEAFYAAKRSGSTRKRDRKKRKHLAEHGEVAFVTAAGSGEIARTVDALIEEKNGAYARMGVANMFEWPGYREFFHDMGNHPRLVHVCRLDVGTKTVAANFGLTFRDTYYYVLAGYDDGELAKFGPGMALLHDLLRYSIEAGLKIFDFTIGDEPYKREWFDAETRLYDCVTPATWRGSLVAMPLAAVRRVKRRIKQDATLWARVRKLRTLVGPMLKRSPR